jgi:hypothetical protein
MAGENMEDRWIKWVALTTTILAVCAAIASLKGGGYSTKVQLYTTMETNRWSYFQSKSIKEHLMGLQKDSFEMAVYGSANPKAKKFIEDKVKFYESEIARYKSEKDKIQKEAEDISKQEDVFKRHSGNFGLAVMFLQIAIMLSAVGALIKRIILWHGGLIIGVAGLVYMLNGFFLWF